MFLGGLIGILLLVIISMPGRIDLGIGTGFSNLVGNAYQTECQMAQTFVVKYHEASEQALSNYELSQQEENYGVYLSYLLEANEQQDIIDNCLGR